MIYLYTTKSLVYVLLHKALEYGYSLLAEPDGIQHVVVKDRFEQIILVVGLETPFMKYILLPIFFVLPHLKGGLARHHLVHEHPQRPPVHAGAIVKLLERGKFLKPLHIIL